MQYTSLLLLTCQFSPPTNQYVTEHKLQSHSDTEIRYHSWMASASTHQTPKIFGNEQYRVAKVEFQWTELISFLFVSGLWCLNAFHASVQDQCDSESIRNGLLSFNFVQKLAIKQRIHSIAIFDELKHPQLCYPWVKPSREHVLSALKRQAKIHCHFEPYSTLLWFMRLEIRGHN